MLDAASGLMSMVNEGGGSNRKRDMGQCCGKMAVWLINLNNLNGFGGPCWYRYLETVFKEEGCCVLMVSLLVVGAGSMDSAGCNSNRMVVLVEFLRDIQSLLEVVVV